MFELALMLLISTCSVQYVTTANDLFIQEGEDADLKFSYHTVVPVEFELIVGYKDPFYKYGQVMADSLTPSQQKRLRVNSWHSALEEHMLVHMKFTSVERTDAGAYTCNLIENGKLISNSTQMISLSVDFPPGPVKCWVLPQEEYNLDVLLCVAVGGSPPGKISCFQNNHKSAPDENDLKANGTHILEKFWITRRNPVLCCSHNEIVMEMKNCKDSVELFLSTQYGSAPFSTELPFETAPHSSQRHLHQTVSYGSNDSLEVQENENAFTLKITFIGLIPVFILILALFSFFLYRKFYSSRQQYMAVKRCQGGGVMTDIAVATESKERSSEMVEKDKNIRKEKSAGRTGNELRSPPITTEHDRE